MKDTLTKESYAEQEKMKVNKYKYNNAQNMQHTKNVNVWETMYYRTARDHVL